MQEMHMMKNIAIPAPTLEAFLGSRKAAHTLLKGKGFSLIIDVYPFYKEIMHKTAEASKSSQLPMISPACPRARRLCQSSSHQQMLPNIPSPAALALLETISKYNTDENVSITFISPCPLKAEELKSLTFPSSISFHVLPMNTLISDLSHYSSAAPYLNEHLALNDLAVPLIRLRGLEAAEKFLAQHHHQSEACVDMQLCENGCISGAWCS